MTRITQPGRGTQPEQPGDRAASLLAEARLAAREHLDDLIQAMDRTVSLSSDIGGGGDIYPPGVRDLCRRMAEDAGARAKSLAVLSERLLPAR